nr:hypothetical protein [Tanacetum cinerariifolium]
EACHLDEQNPKCLEDWDNIDFQDLVVDGESFQVEVHCCRGEDNGLRVCGKDMIVEIAQKHGKRHGAIAFVYDFLHSINDHRSEVKISSNGYVVKHVCNACFYLVSFVNRAKKFLKEKFSSFQIGANVINVEFVEVSKKLSLSGSRSGDGLFDEIMFMAKVIAFGMIIKRV